MSEEKKLQELGLETDAEEEGDKIQESTEALSDHEKKTIQSLVDPAKFYRGGLTWDPFQHLNETITPQCLSRIRRDIKTLFEEPPPGIFVVNDETDLTVIHALLTGPFDTPYEGGFFYFILKCPSDYPLRPPWVKLMTTGGGTVRFNPNLYKNGKVCLSLLGTWPGPGWSPANTLSSCLLSIQSVLCEKPYHNEPGFESEKLVGDVARYNDIIRHETIRVAVCGMIDNETGIKVPEPLVKVMDQTFLEFYETYTNVAKSKLHLTNTQMFDPFGEKRGNYQYKNILKRLEECKNKILSKQKMMNKKSKSEQVEISSDSSDMDEEEKSEDNNK